MGIEDGKAELPAITQQVAPHASSPNRDDRGKGEKRVEPAMAGIPAGAVQRMPQEGIPGLPPVDPADIVAAWDEADACVADNRS